MAITVCGSCVEFGSSTMCDTSPGFSFSGTIKAQCGFQQLPTQAQGSVSGYTSGASPSQSACGIDKFPFASDANAADVGQLTQARLCVAGQSSDVSGYTSGGNGPGNKDTIDKFAFASDGNATDVGELTQGRYTSAGQSSTASGYTSGGNSKDTIDKFPFASDANATDVGNLPDIRGCVTGQQV